MKEIKKLLQTWIAFEKAESEKSHGVVWAYHDGRRSAFKLVLGSIRLNEQMKKG